MVGVGGKRSGSEARGSLRILDGGLGGGKGRQSG